MAMSGADEEERSPRAPFPPAPPPWLGGEPGVEEERRDTPVGEEEAPPGDMEGSEPDAGVPFYAEDPRCWESNALTPGALVELAVSDPAGVGAEAVVVLFLRAVDIGPHGCWAHVRLLGASAAWAQEWAIKTFSREKRRLHICRHGVKHCLVKDAKGYHVGDCFTHAPGEEPPPYVGKAKKREWGKLYEEIMREKQKPRDAVDRGAGDPTLDRVARLKERLMRMKGGGAVAAAPERSRRVHFEEDPPARQPALKDRPVKREKTRVEVVDLVQTTSTPEREGRGRGVRDALASAAAKAAAVRKDEEQDRRKRRSRSRGRRKRKRGLRRDSRSSSSQSRSSSSSSLVPPLQRKAAKNPGSVMKLLMTNVSEALAQAAVTDPDAPVALGATANQISAYYQIVARPQLGNKVRDCRELETLARCLDLLRLGKLPELGDAMAGRFLAVESAGLTNNWADAQHLEVIPLRHAGLAPPSVMLQAQRHTRQVEKAAGRRPWTRPTGSNSGPWNSKGDHRGEAPGGKGDGKGRGKAGKKGQGKAKGAWKDKDKAEGAPEGGGK